MELAYQRMRGWDYYTFLNQGARMGKCLIRAESPDTVQLKYIEIHREHRGKGWASKFWPLMEQEIQKRFPCKRITLEAHEDIQKPDKLVHLYRSWGFLQNGTPKYEYEEGGGEVMIRKVPMVKSL